MGFGNICDGNMMLPIGPGSELMAIARDGFVSVRGPCGEGHTMSYAEARTLRRWLAENVPEPASLDGPDYMAATRLVGAGPIHSQPINTDGAEQRRTAELGWPHPDEFWP